MILKQRFNILENNLKELIKIRDWIWSQSEYMKETDFENTLFNVNKKIDQARFQLSALRYYMIKYSVFSTDDIGLILTEIISIVEGKKFEYQSDSIVWREKFDIRKNNYNQDLIINSEKRKDLYESRELGKLVEDGDAIILPKGNLFFPIPKMQTFVEKPMQEEKLTQFYDMIDANPISESFKDEFLSGGYGILLEDEEILLYSAPSFYPYFYVYDFIEFVISYRMNNLKEKISLDELVELKNEFLEKLKFQLNENEKVEIGLNNLEKKYSMEIF